jgi:hypothetical protein
MRLGGSFFSCLISFAVHNLVQGGKEGPMRKYMWCLAAFICACGGAGEKTAVTQSAPRAEGGDQWFYTCGAPVCYEPSGPIDGVRPCTTEQPRDACSPEGDVCDPGVGCGVLLLCTDRDPRTQPGGCPISRENFKRDIEYLSSVDLERYHDELLSLPLATYRYRDGGPTARKHLGFMIDGHESLICVEAERDMVDVYSYASMAVASLKVQARQIEELQRKVDRLQRKISKKAGR